MKPSRLFMLATAAAAAFALAGCDSEIDVPASFSEVTGKAVTKMVEFSVQIPACQDYQTKLESNSLLEAKQRVPYVIEGAKYKACRKVEFQDYAVFDVPVRVGIAPDQNGIQVYPSRDGIVVSVGKDIQQKAQQLARGFNSFKPEDLKFNLIFTNDSGEELDVYSPSCFLWADKGGERMAAHVKNFKMKPGATLGFTLSNVGAVQAVEQGYAPIIEVPL